MWRTIGTLFSKTIGWLLATSLTHHAMTKARQSMRSKIPSAMAGMVAQVCRNYGHTPGAAALTGPARHKARTVASSGFALQLGG